MFVLQIEHEVLDFASWKKAFDNDPAGREKMGVHQYEIFCLADNPFYVLINLWFEEIEQAENAIVKLQILWDGAGGEVMKNPKNRILEMMDWKFLN